MKKYILALIFCIIGLGCLASYEIIGSYVASDGTLVESFFLIPIGFLLIVISIITGLVTKFVPFFKK
jgi:hypothetical protein